MGYSDFESLSRVSKSGGRGDVSPVNQIMNLAHIVQLPKCHSLRKCKFNWYKSKYVLIKIMFVQIPVPANRIVFKQSLNKMTQLALD